MRLQTGITRQYCAHQTVITKHYCIIPTTKTGYKVNIVILSSWPLRKRSFQCRVVNRGQFQIAFHRNLIITHLA